ncbi:hypothetical protein ABLG96_07995 [Nakamurella sp. A5-74]|uniref:Uncharacterized protein n=1 Tax=Nakamurella sp. A5-74 TaxID=3158264 RepID=A0AAU8DVP4_9ACTN
MAVSELGVDSGGDADSGAGGDEVATESGAGDDEVATDSGAVDDGEVATDSGVDAPVEVHEASIASERATGMVAKIFLFMMGLRS